MKQRAYDLDRLHQCTASIWTRAEVVDQTATIPVADIEALAEADCLAILASTGDANPLHSAAELSTILQAIGAASLTVGRLYEGNVNAAYLIGHYGGARAKAELAQESKARRLLGVWNAERGEPVCLTPTKGGWTITGRKVYCSGAGHIRRPLVTARDPDGAVHMVLIDMAAPGITFDVSNWRATGMRGTATGTVNFDKVHISADAAVGGPGDYYRSPLFSGGAWRVMAVQLGGLKRILELQIDALAGGGRAADAVVRARFAEAAGDYECARLLVQEAGQRAENRNLPPAAIDAYVDQARAQFERLALRQIEVARRNVGLSSFIAPSPLDRCVRDLETYLRQPFLDASRDNAARWLLDRNRFEA